MSSALKALRESLALLASRRFGTFWFASLLSSIGTWAQQVAEPWLLLTLGASPFLIGLDSFAMNAPVWLLTLPGGILADHADRRRVIAWFQSIQMLCPAAIVVLMLTGAVRPWMIVALSVVVGVTDALSMPSFQSIVPSIVERGEISRGLALNSTQFNLSRILGPSIAGVLISSLGAMACFVVSAASYVPFVGVALWILPNKERKAKALDPTVQGRPLAALREAACHPELRNALLTVLTTSLLCSPLVTFSPVLVKDGFHGGASRFSLALASFGVGGLVGAIGLLSAAKEVDRRRVSSGSALAYAVVLVLTALCPWFWAVPLLLMLAGASMTISNTAANSLLQTLAKPERLGQTVSLYMLAMRGGMSIGSLVTGALVGVLGVRHALLLDGLLALAIQTTVARRWSGVGESAPPAARTPRLAG